MAAAAKKTTPPVAESVENPWADINHDFEWEKVNEESPTTVLMDNPGEFIIGHFDGIQDVVTEKVDANSFIRDGKTCGFTQILIRDTLRSGDLYALAYSYKLRDAFDKIPVGSLVKVTYVKDVNITGKNPMKDYVVSVAK